MLIRLLPILAALLPTTFADVKVLTPASGAKVSISGSGISVKWGEGSGSVASSDLASYQIFLMAGGSTDATSGQVGLVAGTGSPSTASSKTIPLLAAAGPSASNAYYIKFVSQKSDGTGQVVNYSNRFTISGMTGGFPGSASGQSAVQVQAAYEKVSGDVSAVPADSEDSSNAAAATPAAATGDVTSYQFQTTGTVKYAPMQKRPGTAITATNTSPQYPTFAHPTATTFLPPPTFVTTQNQKNTASTKSRENNAAAAPAPSNDMAKFLARWKD